MKLSYWVAVCKGDSQVYSLRGKTKKAVLAMLASGKWDADGFEPVKKVSIEYDDAFDLMMECLNEGGGYWES